MKIGIFDPYLDTLGGGEKYILSLAICLSKKHKVFLFWDTSKTREIKEKARKKFGIDIEDITFFPNIFSKKVSLPSRLISSKRFDAIVYLSDGSIPFVGSKLYVHFQFPVEWVNGSSFKVRFKLGRVKGVFCNSFFTKKYIDKKFHMESKVLYPPVMIRKIKGVKENIILHVGRFGLNIEGSNYKKQDLMIGTFKKMVDRGLNNWQFVLIISVREEDEDKLSNLQKMVKGYPIEIVKNPQNDTLWENYAKAKIYWHASGFGEDLGKHPERAEHFGISTVEAMGSGAVPVVINAGGQKEIVENGKNGFLWGSQKELIDYTKLLIKDGVLWKKLSKAASDRAKIFSGDRFCKEVFDIINP